MTIRVLLVDDQPLVRAGLAMVLGPVEDVAVAGEAADGAEAVERTRELAPDLVIMDVRMPVMDGIEATRLITADGLARVMLLTTFDADEHVYGALRAGASGFLLKDAPTDHLVNAIRVIHQGSSLWAPEATRRIVERFAHASGASGAPGASGRDGLASAGLTPRELEVLELMARGASNAEISRELFVTEATAKTHVGHILTKLGARSRTQAVVMAYESGSLGLA